MKDSWPLGLVGSAIGGCAAVVSFTFLTFETKTAADEKYAVERDHAKSEQQNVRDDIEHIRNSIETLNSKIDKLLERTRARQ